MKKNKPDLVISYVDLMNSKNTIIDNLKRLWLFKDNQKYLVKIDENFNCNCYLKG